MDLIKDLQAFNEKFKLSTNERPDFLPDDEMANRLNFQMEELLETAHALGFYFNSSEMVFKPSEAMKQSRNLPVALDGLVDQAYVLIGTVVKMGFSDEALVNETDLSPNGMPFYKTGTVFEEAWRRVHYANMQKVLVPGNWKVQKPAGWTAPNLEDLCK